ncbi:MAG: polysaccharide biosynthesis/export family protein [Verrucomicrobiota bacterium]|jgi:protein involved in polysaccharide export with SLBB domain
MKSLLRLNSLFVLLAGVWTVSAQLPVPMLPLNQSPIATPTSPAAAPTPHAPPAVAVPGLLNGYVPDNTYILRVGDTISFRILEDRIWNPQNAPQSLVVVDSGEVDVPYIGRVGAVGKTSKQLAAEIKTALEKDYYQQATVVLSLNVATPILGRVYIWGQVRNQGSLDMTVNENLTAGKAILRAGGFADFANKRKVKVVHTDAGGKSQTSELDMQQILEDGKIDKDIVLQPNDLIIVPSRLVNF